MTKRICKGKYDLSDITLDDTEFEWALKLAKRTVAGEDIDESYTKYKLECLAKKYIDLIETVKINGIVSCGKLTSTEIKNLQQLLCKEKQHQTFFDAFRLTEGENLELAYLYMKEWLNLS